MREAAIISNGATSLTAPLSLSHAAFLFAAALLESAGFGNVVAGWPEMVNIFVRSSNATLEGQKSTEYKRPGQSFSGLALLGEANRVYGLNLSAVLAFQPEQPIETALTVAVQLCGGLEAYDTVLNRCACSPGAERLFSGDCACVPADIAVASSPCLEPCPPPFSMLTCSW